MILPFLLRYFEYININNVNKQILKKCTVLVMLLVSMSKSYSQFKVDVHGQMLIDTHKAAEMAARHSEAPNVVDNPRTTAIIRLTDSSALDEIIRLGGNVLDSRFDMAIVDIPIGRLEQICNLSDVNHVDIQKEVSIMNDEARKASGVESIRSGVIDNNGIPLGYDVDGTGVVVGLMDTGLDPNHINFFDLNGKSRVKGITHFTGSTGASRKYTTAEEIAKFTTETTSQTHGTHVLGTMAGSYKDGQYDYSGVATGADIYVSCGSLFDSNLLLGIRDVLEYAQSVNKPAVVNLSIGNTSGSHDEFTVFGQYVEYLVNSYSPCPIITISAGNDAKKSIAIKKTFTADEKTFTTIVSFNPTISGQLTGSLEIYGDDSTPFIMRPVIYNKSNKEIVATLDAMTVAGAGFNKTFYCYETFDDYPIPELAEYFTGSIGIQSAVNTSSGRYYVTFAPNLTARTSTSYCFGFTIEGKAGHTVYAYHYSSKGTTFSDGGREDFTSGTADGTINGLACGRRVAVVGSYNTRVKWPNYEGKIYGYSKYPEYAVGLISDFTSWGTLWDGRNLPDFVAPGSMISSSLNAYNMESTSRGVSESGTTVISNVAGRNQYWGVMRGTSMAAPFAAGVFALWKQVNPELTVEDAVWIAKETAITDEYVDNVGVQAGAGKLDADAGIKMVLSGASVENVLENGGVPFLVKSSQDNCFEIQTAGNVDFVATVFSMSGVRVKSGRSVSGHLSLDCSNMQKGVYILSVHGKEFWGSKKIIIK